MMTLSRWLAPAALAVGLSVGALAAMPAHAQDNTWTRVLVDAADVALRGGQPYYRYGNYRDDDRLVVVRDHVEHELLVGLGVLLRIEVQRLARRERVVLLARGTELHDGARRRNLIGAGRAGGQSEHERECDADRAGAFHNRHPRTSSSSKGIS